MNQVTTEYITLFIALAAMGLLTITAGLLIGSFVREQPSCPRCFGHRIIKNRGNNKCLHCGNAWRAKHG